MNIVAFPSFHIESFSQHHVDACSDFLHNSWHQNYASLLPAEITSQKTQQYFRQYLSTRQGICWVALMGEKVVGLLSVSSNCVVDLWVDIQFQRRKIGSRLLDIALHHFKQKKFQTAQLGCESFNRNMLNFINSKGWRQIGSESIEITPATPPVQALVFATSLARV